MAFRATVLTVATNATASSLSSTIPTHFDKTQGY